MWYSTDRLVDGRHRLRGGPVTSLSCAMRPIPHPLTVHTGAIQPSSLPLPPPISTRWWALHLLVLLALGSYLLTDMVTLALELSHAHALYLTSVISAISLASLARRLQLSGGGGARVQAMAVVCAVLAIVAVIAPWANADDAATNARTAREVATHVAARLWRSTSIWLAMGALLSQIGQGLRDESRRAGLQTEHGQLLAQCGRVASRCMYGSFAAAGACVAGGTAADWWSASEPATAQPAGSFGLRWL